MTSTMEDELDAILSQIDPKQLLSLESATFDLLIDDSASSLTFVRCFLFSKQLLLSDFNNRR